MYSYKNTKEYKCILARKHCILLYYFVFFLYSHKNTLYSFCILLYSFVFFCILFATLVCDCCIMVYCFVLFCILFATLVKNHALPLREAISQDNYQRSSRYCKQNVAIMCKKKVYIKYTLTRTEVENK